MSDEEGEVTQGGELLVTSEAHTAARHAALLATGTVSAADAPADAFAVAAGDGAAAPAFQFDETGAVRAELRPILEVLCGAGVGGWQLWVWLTTPTPLLSGEVPERLARTEPARVLRAAQRFVGDNAA